MRKAIVALQCASELEAWAKMIREYAGLSLLTLPTAALISNSVNSNNSNTPTTINSNQDSYIDKEDDLELKLFEPPSKVDQLHQMMFGNSFGS